MKKLLIGLSALTLMACASTQLPKDATPAQKQAAKCEDAQAALAMADAVISKGGLGNNAAVYWTAYKSGAEVAISAYCGAQ